MNKKLLILIVSLFTTIIFASDATDTIDLAKMYEKDGNVNKAMKLYKKAALMLTQPKENYIKNEDIVNFGNNSIKSYDSNETDQTIKQIIYSTFAIESYRMNYFLPVTYDSKNHVAHDRNDFRKKVETKFQISFRKRLLENIFGIHNTLYLAYTQVSLWQTTAPSGPFRETNYEPEIFLNIPYEDSQSFLKSYRIGLLHQSNGRLAKSKSWNRAYLSGIFQYDGIFFEPRIWYRFKEDKKANISDVNGDDNPDILHYLGYGDITITYPYKQHLFSTILRKKSVQLDWTFPVFGLKNIYGYLQFFSGYGESLVDYNEKVEKIGLGFAITR